MPKHRGTVYTVVREEWKEDMEGAYVFSALIGTYTTLMRAEEVKGASAQALRDAGADYDDYQFTVHPVTFYDE
jgi:hypothetical protein